MQYPTDLLSDWKSDQNIKTAAKSIFVYQADFTRTDIGHLILSVSESDQQVRSLSNNKGAFSAIVSKSFYAQHRFTESLLKQVKTFQALTHLLRDAFLSKKSQNYGQIHWIPCICNLLSTVKFWDKFYTKMSTAKDTPPAKIYTLMMVK